MIQTVAISLSNTAWTAVSENHKTIAVDIKTAGRILVHLGGADTPAIDAPGISYSSWRDGPDMIFEGLTTSDRVWCRSIDAFAEIVVVRK